MYVCMYVCMLCIMCVLMYNCICTCLTEKKIAQVEVEHKITRKHLKRLRKRVSGTRHNTCSCHNCSSGMSREYAILCLAH